MKIPHVSLLIAVHNRAQYIAETVRSALGQTYPELEVVVVDDGSDDATASILQTFSDPRLQVFYKPHTHCWDTKNRALFEARGEYVVYLDSDDLLEPDFVAQAMEFIAATPGADWYYPARLQIMESDGTPTNQVWRYLEIPPETPDRIIDLYLQQLIGGIPHTGAFVRRDAFARCGMFNGDLYNFGDTDYVVRHAHELKFQVIPGLTGYRKRHHDGQICKQMEPRCQVMAGLLCAIFDRYPLERLFPAAENASQRWALAIERVVHHGQNPMLSESSWRRPFEELAAQLIKRSRSRDRDVQPRVSVHIAVYNRSEYFRQTLSAVLSFRGGPFEVRIVDDGSSENIRSVVDEFDDPRVKYHRFESNRGPWAAFDYMIRETTAEWIMPIGSDDLPDAGYLAGMLESAGCHPEDEYFYADHFPLIDADGHSMESSWMFADFSGEGIWQIPRIMLQYASGPVPHAGAMIRRALYERFGLYDEAPNVQDTVWISRHFENIRFRRVETQSAPYRYRIHEGNVSRQRADFRNRSLAKAMSCMAERLPAEKLYPDLTLGQTAEKNRRLSDCFQGHARRLAEYGASWQEVADTFAKLPASEWGVMPESASRPPVRILMVTYNRGELTRQTLDALFTVTEHPFRLTVIDNHSTDDTPSLLLGERERGHIDRLVFLDKNYGLAAAANAVWAEATEDLVIRLDNDIVFSRKDWLSRLDELFTLAGDHLPGAVSLDFFHRSGSEERYLASGHAVRVPRNQCEVYGGCVAIPRQTFETYGYWCEDYGQYGWEDSDYGIRLMLGGSTTYFAPFMDGYTHLGEADPGQFADYMAFKTRKFEELNRSAGEHVLAYMLGIRPLRMRRRYRTVWIDELRAQLVPDEDYQRVEEIAMRKFRAWLREENITVAFPAGDDGARKMREQYHRLKERFTKFSEQ